MSIDDSKDALGEFNRKERDRFVRNLMIPATVIICVLVSGYVFLVPHPEETKAWRDDMATKDCTTLANYLVDSKNTPNYTKLASDNVQFVYNTYKNKGCSMAWFP